MLISSRYEHRVAFLFVLMLVHGACSPGESNQSNQQTTHRAEDGDTISLGMRHKAALEIIRECGGQDITSNMAVVGPNGEWPLSGLFWNLEEYNSVLEIAAEDGHVVLIRYWTVADFSESKIHRLESKLSLKSLTFEKRARKLKIQSL